MWCSITRGWFIGNRSRCDSHWLYVVWFWVIHWHKYVLVFTVILFLSLVSFVVCFSITCMGNCIGLFFMLGGGFGCSGCDGGIFSVIPGVISLFIDMYCVLSVRACGCLLHGVRQF